MHGRSLSAPTQGFREVERAVIVIVSHAVVQAPTCAEHFTGKRNLATERQAVPERTMIFFHAGCCTHDTYLSLDYYCALYSGPDVR